MTYGLHYRNIGYQVNLTYNVKNVPENPITGNEALSKRFITPDDPRFVSALNHIMQSHNVLAPEIFAENLLLKPEVRDKLLLIYQTVKQRFVSLFPKAKTLDVLLAGSLCSYLYTEESDLDLFIVIDDIDPHDLKLTKRILGNLNLFFTDIYFRPNIYQYPVDVGVLHSSSVQLRSPLNKYSLLRNEWLGKPQCRNFPFSIEELARAYRYEYYKLISYMSSLEKNNQGMLSFADARQAMDYLHGIRYWAFEAKENSPTHEYSFEYNVYRLLKHCGVYGWYRRHINQCLNQAKEIS